jgi:molybdopterin-guanine dinucleotide biosynthesis protein A
LKIVVIILSGGKGTRAGGKDKGWCEYQGKPFIKTVLSQLQQQVKQLCDSHPNYQIEFTISANRNLADYRQLGVEVITDQRTGFCGPLAGIESVINKYRNGQIDRWVVYPVDSVEVPTDYLLKMLQLDKSQTGYLVQKQQAHYAHLSISKNNQSTLSNYLDTGGRSIKGWLKESRALPVNFMDGEVLKNINS